MTTIATEKSVPLLHKVAPPFIYEPLVYDVLSESPLLPDNLQPTPGQWAFTMAVYDADWNFSSRLDIC